MFAGQDSTQKRVVDSLIFRQLSIESNGQLSLADSKNEIASNRDNFQDEVVKTNKRMLKDDGNAVSEFKVKLPTSIMRPLIVDELRGSKPSFDSPVHRKKVFKPIPESDFNPDLNLHENNIPFWYSANSKNNIRNTHLDKNDNRLFQNKKSTQNELRNSSNVVPGKDLNKHLNMASSTDKSLIYGQKPFSNPFQKKSNRCKNENKLLARTFFPDQLSNNTQLTTPKTHQKKFSFDIAKLEGGNLRTFQKGIFGNDDSKGDASTKSKKDSASLFSGMASSFVKSNAAPIKKHQEPGSRPRVNGAHSIDTDHSAKHRPKFL